MATIGIDPGETKSVSNENDPNHLSKVGTTLKIAAKKQDSGAFDSDFILTRKERNSDQPDANTDFGFGTFEVSGGITPRGSIVTLMPGGNKFDHSVSKESRVRVRRSGRFLMMIRAVYPKLEAKLSRRSELIPSLYFKNVKRQR